MHFAVQAEYRHISFPTISINHVFIMNLRLVIFASLILLISACERQQALNEYYARPGNFGGSIYTALDSTGMHSKFISCIDSAYFGNMLRNTLVTVVAPSDKAFEDYFEKHGYGSISDIPERKLEDLIGHHIFLWPQSPTEFTNTPHIFKRQTQMAQDTVSKYDVVSESWITVVQETKYLQFYTPEMLAYYEGNADDYNILTGSELSPATGINVYDAPVDSVIPYGNGWVYYTDKVVEPRQNLDDWLTASEHTMFSDMYGRFNIFSVDGSVNEGIPRNIPSKRSSLYHYERGYRIDMELCFESVGNTHQAGDYRIDPRAVSNFTVIAPPNNALETFIDNTFQDYPGFKENLFVIDPSLENLHIKLIVRHMITPSMFIAQCVFPSQMAAGTACGNDGTIINLNPEDLLESTLCSNGYAYGASKYIVPRTFESILKPVFTTPDFKFVTAAIDFLEITNYLNDKDANYTWFLPTDEAFLKNNIHLIAYEDAIENWSLSLDNRLGLSDYVFYNNDTTGGNEPDMFSPIELFELVFNHLFTSAITLTSEQLFLKNDMAKYLGVTQDSVWSGGNIVGRSGSRTKSPEITDDLSDFVDNGKLYVVDDIIVPPKYTFGELIAEDTTYSRFKDICEDAGLYVDGSLQVFGGFPTAFIPTNSALNKYINEGNLPANEADLQSFIKYFFVNETVFTNETINGTFETISKDELLSTEFQIVYRKADLEGGSGVLKVKGTGNTEFLEVTQLRNIICDDGIIHQINGVLEY
jgi:uncharacterized surface protein with fasciclin (FAS1) repeats